MHNELIKSYSERAVITFLPLPLLDHVPTGDQVASEEYADAVQVRIFVGSWVCDSESVDGT